jgi:hypothetical protein
MENQTVKIIGKGPSSALFDESPSTESDIVVAINQAACIITRPIDFLFANDIEGLENIPTDIIHTIKNIAIPEYPHINGWSNINKNYTHIVEKFHKDSNLIIYNLWTSPQKNTNLISLDKSISTADTAISFFAKIHKIEKFELYGIGISNGYNPNISNILPSNLKKFGNGWNPTRHLKLKENIAKLQKQYGFEIIYN